MYFNVNFNVFFKLIKVHFLVRKRYVYQNARWNKKKMALQSFKTGVIYLFIYLYINLNVTSDNTTRC